MLALKGPSKALPPPSVLRAASRLLHAYPLVTRHHTRYTGGYENKQEHRLWAQKLIYLQRWNGCCQLHGNCISETSIQEAEPRSQADQRKQCVKWNAEDPRPQLILPKEKTAGRRKRRRYPVCKELLGIHDIPWLC